MDGPEGSVHRENLRTPDSAMLLRYTFGPDKAYTTYRPMCTFFGYRYASITADSEVEIKSLRSIPVSSITAEMETGSLECGNELINQLISNTLWGDHRLSPEEREAWMDRRYAGFRRDRIVLCKH